MTNTELLRYTSKEMQRLLTSIQRQEQYCLIQATAQNPCPVCKTPVSLIEASGLDLDAYPAGKGVENHACPKCSAPLVEIVPFFPHGNGGWYWEVKGDWLAEQLAKIPK